MQESKSIMARFRQSHPIMASTLEQAVCPHDVGVHEGVGTRDRSIDMAFCGQVNYGVGCEPFEGPFNGAAVADVGL
jgi:hypothetical protein